MLNDDVLLNVFKIYLLDIRGEEEEENDRQRWWYKLAHVSRGWRSLIFASQVQLDLHLLCTYGVPVAEMLAHSPPLPLTIFYNKDDREMTEEDEEGVLLSLSRCHDRVRRIALASNLGKSITAIDKVFPVLERICIRSRADGSTRLVFPGTFQAPNLRHLWTASIGYPLLTNTATLVNLELIDIPTSSSFPPSYIRTRILLMPQLETLVIHFRLPPSSDVETQPSNTPVETQFLLHLHLVPFRGLSAYLEGLVARISAPVLDVLDVQFSNQLTFTQAVPRLQQFMQTSENFKFSAVQITFGRDVVDLMAVSNQSGWQHPPFLRLRIGCLHLDWQVSSVVQVFGTLSPTLSVLENLVLDRIGQSPEWPNQVTRTQWRELFRTFSTVKTLRVSSILAGELSLSLCSEGGEKPLELFPNLLEIQYFDGGSIGEAFTPFITEREVAGHTVRLVRDLSSTCDGFI
jgi:hypothetical protein